MNKLEYPFYPIPKVVFDNPMLSPCAKLLFTVFVDIEAFLVNTKGLSRGSFFLSYLSTLANRIGRSADSVRKEYIPELIKARYIEKKHLSEHNENSHRTECVYRIVWDNI